MEIFAAINRADPAAVLECLKKGTDVNCPDPWDREKPPKDRKHTWSPLMKALYLDPSPRKCEIISLLLEAGASLQTVTAAMEDHPPLCLLAEDGDAAAVDLLLKAGADFQLRGEKGSCLGLAVKSLSIPTVNRLLEAGMSFPTSGPVARAFFWLASSSNEMLQLLMENGVEPARCPRLSEEDIGMLDESIQKGNTRQIGHLISLGIDPEDTTWDKTSRLLLCGTDAEFEQHLNEMPDLTKTYGWGDYSLSELAVQRDLITKLQLLINAGADPMKCRDARPHNGSSLLHVAAEYGSVQCIDLLLTLGLNVHLRADLGHTPLMDACENGRLEAANLLLKAGAAVHETNDFSATALNLAGEWSSRATPANTIEILKLLHRHGADLNHVDDQGVGIAKEIAAEGNHGALRWLVEAGADLNLNGYEGTPLRRAVLNDDLTGMEILLQGGADPNARLEDDETVLFDVQSAASVRLLLKYGADPSLLDNLFDRIAVDSIRDPIIKAAFPEASAAS